MVYMFLANGFEETEAICPLDILRRAGVDVKTVSVSDSKTVTSSRKIRVEADMLLSQIANTVPQAVILPGGMPGASNLNIPAVHAVVRSCYDHDGIVGAICAAPFILGEMGLLAGKKATCYPGFEDHLKGAVLSDEKVVFDGRTVTAAGMGVAFEFGLKLTEALVNKECAEKIRKSVMA